MPFSPKILLLGDYSNCHANLSVSLKDMGYDVTLIRPVNYLSSDIVDVDISRKPGLWGGLEYLLKVSTVWRSKFKGYDIVAIHDPNFLDLKPEKLKFFFNRLKKDNGKVFYTSMSVDINLLRMMEDKNTPLKLNEHFIDGKPTEWHLEQQEKWRQWHHPKLMEYQDEVFAKLDGAVSVLYEYHKGLQYYFKDESKIGYGGIPVITKNIPFIGVGERGPVRFLLCRDRNRIKMKGSHILEAALSILKEKYPEDVEIEIAENLPFSIFIEKLKKADVVLDQVYSYTPATTALLSMAMGKTVVTGGAPEYYEFINETANFPIINASINPEVVAQRIEDKVFDRKYLIANSDKSREFVVKHNDGIVVAKRFLQTWLKM